MKEYEYSFKVKRIKEYIEYCEKESFIKEKEVKQTRDLYINSSNILARITISKIDDIENIEIDFKESDDTEKILKNTKESAPLKLDRENLKAFYTILDILGYKRIKHLIRTRYVYKKGKVKFEIDKYTSPEKMNVVAIEGEKRQVDKKYEEVSTLIKQGD